MKSKNLLVIVLLQAVALIGLLLANLYSDESKTVNVLDSRDASLTIRRIVFASADGSNTVYLEASETRPGTLVVRDGKAREAHGVAEISDHGLALRDRRGRLRAEFALTDEGTASLSLCGTPPSLPVYINVDADGSGMFQSLDKNGRGFLLSPSGVERCELEWRKAGDK